MFTLGPVGALRHRRPFTEATLREIRGVAAITGPETHFQIEVPAELVLLAKAPAASRPLLATRLAKVVTGLAAATPGGTRFGVHLCLGDMSNRAYGKMTDVRPLVLPANAIQRGWPEGRPLEIIHAPFAAAEKPAATDPAFYQPLRDLVLPDKIRFAPGSFTSRSRWRPTKDPGHDRGPARAPGGDRSSLRAGPPAARSSNARRSSAPTEGALYGWDGAPRSAAHFASAINAVVCTSSKLALLAMVEIQ